MSMVVSWGGRPIKTVTWPATARNTRSDGSVADGLRADPRCKHDVVADDALVHLDRYELGPRGSSSTTSASPRPGSAPSAPTAVSALGGSAGQASVSFTPPDSDGGSPVSSYTVTADPGGATTTGVSSPIAVSGLTDGSPYTFTVTATNAIGTGPSSLPSGSVIPGADAWPDADPIPLGGSPTATGQRLRLDRPLRAGALVQVHRHAGRERAGQPDQAAGELRPGAVQRHRAGVQQPPIDLRPSAAERSIFAPRCSARRSSAPRSSRRLSSARRSSRRLSSVPRCSRPLPFSPSAFSPSAFSPSVFSPSEFCPSTDPNGSDYEGAQERSLIAVSAGTRDADQQITADTWNNTGYFYIRVTGANGAYDPGCRLLTRRHRSTRAPAGGVVPSSASLFNSGFSVPGFLVTRP